MGAKNKNKGKKKNTEGGESARTDGSNQNSFREKEETKTEEPTRKVIETEPIVEEPKKEDDTKQNEEE